MIVVAAARGWLALWSGLPVLDGRLAARGLSGKVIIEQRVALSRSAARGGLTSPTRSGFLAPRTVFADRTVRRTSAGELSALLGVGAARRRPTAAVAPFPNGSEGRNRGRVSRTARDPRCLRGRRERGCRFAHGASLRVSFAARCARALGAGGYIPGRSGPMLLQLQEADAHTKIQRGLVRSNLRPPRRGSSMPRPPTTRRRSTAPTRRVPSPVDCDLRDLGSLDFSAPPGARSRSSAGHNDWALAATAPRLPGPRSWPHALDDPGAEHLVPCQARARGDRSRGRCPRRPLPPVVVAGSNRHVAWGFAEQEHVIVAVPIHRTEPVT